MDNKEFYKDEKLYRAVIPEGIFLKPDGRVSSAAFKDRNGLSIDRQLYRENEEAVRFIKSQRKGEIFSFTVNACNEREIQCVYLPIPENKYHSELHKDSTKKLLTDSQAKFLAQICKKESV